MGSSVSLRAGDGLASLAHLNKSIGVGRGMQPSANVVILTYPTACKNYNNADIPFSYLDSSSAIPKNKDTLAPTKNTKPKTYPCLSDTGATDLKACLIPCYLS